MTKPASKTEAKRLAVQRGEEGLAEYSARELARVKGDLAASDARLAVVRGERDAARTALAELQRRYAALEDLLGKKVLETRALRMRLLNRGNDLAEARKALADVRAAWLMEANQGDGILEDHEPVLQFADRVLARGES